MMEELRSANVVEMLGSSWFRWPAGLASALQVLDGWMVLFTGEIYSADFVISVPKAPADETEMQQPVFGVHSGVRKLES